MIVGTFVTYLLIGMACLTTFCTAAIILLTVAKQVQLYIVDLMGNSPLRGDFLDELYEDIDI